MGEVPGEPPALPLTPPGTQEPRSLPQPQVETPQHERRGAPTRLRPGPSCCLRPNTRESLRPRCFALRSTVSRGVRPEVSACQDCISGFGCRQSQPAHSTYSSRWSSRAPSLPPTPHPQSLTSATLGPKWRNLPIHFHRNPFKTEGTEKPYLFFSNHLSGHLLMPKTRSKSVQSEHNFTKSSGEGGPLLQADTAQSRLTAGPGTHRGFC